MKRAIVFAAFLYAIFIACVPSAGRHAFAVSPEVAEKTKPAVVAIYGDFTDGILSDFFGSGFFISGNRIITAKHVVENHPIVWARLYDGRKIKLIRAGFQENDDLAILLILNPEREKSNVFEYLNFGNIDDVAIDDSVAAIGNTSGHLWQVIYGTVRNLNYKISIKGTEAHPVSVAYRPNIFPGFSGSPLINKNGDVVGVNVAVNYLSFAVGLAEVRSFIQEFDQKPPDIKKIIEEIVSQKSPPKKCAWIYTNDGKWCKNRNPQ